MSNRQSLERISLSGYKSFRKLADFPLGPGLNVLIGANGAGKSNFLRFFEMLGHIMDRSKGLQSYVRSRGGAGTLLFRGPKVTSQIDGRLEFNQYDYQFTLQASDDQSLFFASETVKSRSATQAPNPESYSQSGLESHVGRQTGPINRAISQVVSHWRVHHFHDTTPSAQVMGLCNIVDNEVLHGNAANLAAILMRMAGDYPEYYLRIERTVRQVAPFFGSFALKEVSPGQTQLLWKDRYSDLLYYPHQLSDGTLRYICLATLLLQPKPPLALFIDEPELGLHPYAIKLLASPLHEASESTQLIVSTQASHLLDELSPEQVIAVNHRDGESQLERQDPERLRAWLEEYTLGQLWEKNELGGTP